MRSALLKVEHVFDVVVVGTSGSGLRCAYECNNKWFKNRSCN